MRTREDTINIDEQLRRTWSEYCRKITHLRKDLEMSQLTPKVPDSVEECRNQLRTSTIATNPHPTTVRLIRQEPVIACRIGHVTNIWYMSFKNFTILKIGIFRLYPVTLLRYAALCIVRQLDRKVS